MKRDSFEITFWTMFGLLAWPVALVFGVLCEVQYRIDLRRQLRRRGM